MMKNPKLEAPTPTFGGFWTVPGSQVRTKLCAGGCGKELTECEVCRDIGDTETACKPSESWWCNDCGLAEG